jgi:glucose-1-phosphate thymidylyltransferase
MSSRDHSRFQRVVGLIPAAGQATRIAPLPCSKELYPIGFHCADIENPRPKVVAHYLLEKMKFAGVSTAYIVLRVGKWDIPAYFADGSGLDMQIAYLMMGAPFGVPFTLNQAYPFVRDSIVAFGFPDILFEDNDAFTRLLDRLSDADADIVLGLFPANHPSKEDTVDFTSDGHVRDITLRPSNSSLRYTWGIAVWAPRFTEFLHDYVNERIPNAARNPELSAGHAIKAAIDAGCSVSALVISENPYLDIGTPEDLLLATRRAQTQINTD